MKQEFPYTGIFIFYLMTICLQCITSSCQLSRIEKKVDKVVKQGAKP